MKKSTIKRRKRVVPAYPEAPVTIGSPSETPVSTGSPDPMIEDIDTGSEPSSSAKRMRLPPIIDFTGYRPDLTTSDPAAYKEVNLPRRSPLLSAAPLSRAQPATEDYAMQAQLAAAAATDGMQLDPALNLPPYHSRTSPTTSTDDNERLKTERRATLMREAEVMRAALRAKEREIDELER